MGFHLPPGEKFVEVPFEFDNNFIVVSLVLNDVFPLKFLFDTGAENTILVKKAFTDILNVSYDREFKILGADRQTELTAYLVRGVQMNMPNLYGPRLDILVLEKDYFEFEKYVGTKIHGILGMDLFKTFTIEVDYQRQVLTFYRIENFKLPNRKFKKIKADVHRNKPYIRANINIRATEDREVKLLLDTGASLALLLDHATVANDSMPTKLIPGEIGNGLGGRIEGYVGRVNRLAFDDFDFNSVITNFQLEDSLHAQAPDFNRNGIIGNELLSRFRVIFDLTRETVYFNPIKKYNRRFRYDRSGITLIAEGNALNIYRIKELVPGSPAAEAGARVGDIVRRVNGIPAPFFDLPQLTRNFQKRPGKLMKLVLEREGRRFQVRFRLRDLI